MSLRLLLGAHLHAEDNALHHLEVLDLFHVHKYVLLVKRVSFIASDETIPGHGHGPISS